MNDRPSESMTESAWQPIRRADLFGNPEKAGSSISPDGTHIAFLAPLEGVLNVFVAPRGDLASARPVTREPGRGIRMYDWAEDSRHILALKDKDGDENWHVHAVAIATGTMRDLTPHEGVQASVMKLSRHHEGAVLITHNRRDERFPDLYRVEIATGEETLIAENPGLAGFLVDDDFTVRLAATLEPDGSAITLKPDGKGGWQEFLRVGPADAMVSQVTDDFAPDGGTTLALSSVGRDTSALYRIDLASGALTLIAEDSRADIDAVIVEQETNRPLAFRVNYDRARYQALDDALSADIDFLDGAGIGDWSINSRTRDDSVWIIGAASDTVPGAAFLYDRRVKTLEKLYDTRPALAELPLAPMQPVVIRSRDGLDLVSYLTRPRLPAGDPPPLVLVVHGGPWARDSFGFHPYHQWLADRGYAVLSVNFRASTGFGKSFINAGDHEWGRKMDDDLLDAVDWAIGKGVADPARVAILGGSYGGYAVLAAMTRNPDCYACGVDIVGPSNLETLLATVPPYWESFRSILVKALGDPNTETGAALLRERSPVHVADRLARPLLIAQGANDPRVKQAESDQMVAALKAKDIPVTYALFPDEGHGFARPENNIAFIAIAEGFLARHLGARAEPVRRAELEASTVQLLEGADVI